MEKELNDVNEECFNLKKQRKLEVFDDILSHVGGFGKYQLTLILIFFPFAIAFLIVFFSQIFITVIPQKHWCKVNEVSDLNLTQEQKFQLVIPQSKQYPYYDRCHYKKLNLQNSSTTSDKFNISKWETGELIQCNQWEYDFNDVPYASIGVELNWVCNREYLIATAQSIFYFGSIFGNFIFGWISDRYGRTRGLLCCSATAFIASIGTANSYNFWTFAICRFLMGFAYDNIIIIPFIIVLEYTSAKRRSEIGCLVFGFNFALGLLVVTWSPYIIKNWRHFAYFNSLPCLLCFFITFLMPESARWYLTKGKVDELLKKLRRISKVNNKIPREGVFEEFLENITYRKENVENATLLDIRSTPSLAKNVLLLAIVFSQSTLTMDTYIYYSNRYDMSIFMSFTWFSVECFIAAIFTRLISIRWGLRFSGFLGLLLATVFGFTLVFTKNETVKIVAGSLGRMCTGFVQILYSQYVAEFFPTSLRTQGSALIHFASTWRELPMLIIATLTLINSILILFLPETTGKNLRQTLQEGEDFCKNKKFWPILV
ncbi:carcinine transporter-like isoform X2 [Leptopilina boulardi]|uniref:carcinine transporter-like isoform X2 n=1 Tax=Leptopilina boulardi TaxID=63433 RepID=UPI0021F64968|nr:carcinine transporter-like isoform X2 [Leptopilina boulardi]